ncbi:MAG: flagellar hook protein FlgE [Sneathiella sp.]|nr:flagellar hook protein FlgE [Sneathiella sp.]
MSLTAAMFSGVSGLAAQSMSMGMIADNISNVNTVGFKDTKAVFSTLVTESTTGTTYSPGGVVVHPTAQVDKQGLITASTTDTNMAIAGDGFFVVHTLADPSQTGGNYFFTRAGTFEPDAEGNLRNAQGYYLQGWEIDVNGNIPSNQSDLTALSPVNVSGLTGNAEPTSAMDLNINLSKSETPELAYVAGDMLAGTITADFVRSFQVIDSAGEAHGVTFSFVKTGTAAAPNEWSVEITADLDGDGTDDAITVGNGGLGILAFNTDGSLDTGNTTLPTSFDLQWAASLGIGTPQTVALDYGTDNQTDGITHFAGNSELVSSEVNGALFGSFKSVFISEEGVVIAQFDNGTSKDIFKIPLATFPNPNELINEDGNAYGVSPESGVFTLREATLGGAGKVLSSATEASTVDIAEEFTRMIVTQRSYSAASKIITTADEMLEELIRIKR